MDFNRMGEFFEKNKEQFYKNLLEKERQDLNKKGFIHVSEVDSMCDYFGFVRVVDNTDTYCSKNDVINIKFVDGSPGTTTYAEMEEMKRYI